MARTIRISCLAVLASIFLFVTTSWVHAQIASDSANVSDSEPDKEAIREKLKERIEDVAQAGLNAQELDEILLQEPDPNTIMGYFGTISEATLTSLVIVDDQAQSHEINLEEDTELSLFAKGETTTINPEEIETDWFAIAMGQLDQAGQMQALRISFTQEYEPPTPKHIILGQITELEDDTLQITSAQKTQTFELTQSPTILIKGVDSNSFDDIRLEDKVIGIYTEQEPEDDEEDVVHLLRGLFVYPSINNPLASASDENEDEDQEATGSADTEESPESE